MTEQDYEFFEQMGITPANTGRTQWVGLGVRFLWSQGQGQGYWLCNAVLPDPCGTCGADVTASRAFSMYLKKVQEKYSDPSNISELKQWEDKSLSIPGRKVTKKRF